MKIYQNNKLIARFSRVSFCLMKGDKGDLVEVEIAEMERYLFGYRDTTTKYRILGDMIED